MGSEIRKSYTTEDVEVGLSTLALCSGNASKASKVLEEMGQRIPASTLKYWRAHEYPDRYHQIERDELPKRYARIAEWCEAIADQAADVEEQLIEQLRQQAPQLPGREISNALRNASVTKAVNIDKANLVRGRPTEIHATADVTEILRGLATRFGSAVQVSATVREGEACEENSSD